MKEKSKEQLVIELEELLKKSKKEKEELQAANQKLQASEQQLKASNQQLQASEQQLRAANQQLIAGEQELKKEKIFSEKIVETANAIIVGLDKDHIIKIFNRGAEQITGYKKEEVIGKDWFNIFFPKEILDEMNKVWNEGWGTKSHSYINLILAKSGEERIVSWQTTGMYDSHDASKHLLLSIGEDITKRKKAESELIILSTAVTQSPSVIAITDTKGNLQYANPKFTEITGYSKEEVIGKNPRVLKSGEQSDEMYKELWKTVSSGKTWQGEFHNKKKNGELFWEMASVSPIFDEQGKIINYIKVAEDITERKQAEDNFRNSIDESPLGHKIVNQAGKTIYVNKALLDIYGFSSPDEFISTKAIERYTEKSYHERQERKKIRQKGGDISEYEISIRRKNGEIRHIKVWRKEVIWNREKHYQVINQDITELKILYSDLILAKEKAEESDRLKSAFLANMSHEIRTPMNGILGFTELLKEPNLSADDQKDFIQTIQISGERMLNTINNIVDVSKIESGLTKVDIKAVDINEKMEFAHKFFKPEIEKKGLQFSYNIGLPSEDAIILTDIEKVYGILTNLIKNAIKFTYNGSVEFGYEKKGNFLEFYVKDNGVGIPKNQKEFIFERFRQGSNDYNRLYEGSGLGLSISKSYSEMLGGKIRVESEEGLGSTFYFTIPYITESTTKTELKSTVSSKQQEVKNLKILIVEDDEVSYSLLSRLVKKASKEVLHAVTGIEAIKACKNNPDLDLVLMDIRMPEMDGLEATSQIREFNKDLVIIAQTAYGFENDCKKVMEAGCNDYIAKPISKDKLLALIKKYSGK